MAWYFLKNEEGEYIGKKVAGRGRPPAGWVKSETDLAPHLSEAGGVKTLEKPKKEKMVDVLFDENGKMIDHKDSLRGRCTAGWERIPATEFIALLGSPVTKSSTEAPKITHIKEVEAPVVAQIKEEEDEEDAGTQYFSLQQKIPYDDFLSAIDHTVHPDIDDEDRISLVACNVHSRLDDTEEHFPLGKSYSRIDIIRSSGDIHIWTTDALSDRPDIILEEALIDIED